MRINKNQVKIKTHTQKIKLSLIPWWAAVQDGSTLKTGYAKACTARRIWDLGIYLGKYRLIKFIDVAKNGGWKGVTLNGIGKIK